MEFRGMEDAINIQVTILKPEVCEWIGRKEIGL